MGNTEHRAVFPLRGYDLATTLGSGQAFRWRPCDEAWEGVVAGRWVRLTADRERLEALTTGPCPEWSWLTGYLRLDEDLAGVIATFPDDGPMRAAVAACPGLRLLRQEPWECLASFILSSTKQIVQIQQCVALLCERFGEPLAEPTGAGVADGLPAWPDTTPAAGRSPTPPPAAAKEPRGRAARAPDAWSTFPSFARLAAASETELRACKLGFRARYLLGTARMLAAGEADLGSLRRLPTAAARAELTRFPGVGRKIADCVLLFAYGRQDAFPVDVWVLRALRALYFPKRRPTPQRLLRFTETYFGPNAGYAQQYLFHYMRTKVPELQARPRRGRDA